MSHNQKSAISYIRTTTSSASFIREVIILSITLTLILCAFLVSSCAKETSKEAKEREKLDRQIARLEKGAGYYEGYIESENGKNIPASLNLTIQRNPSAAGDAPSFQAVLKLGFFGSTTLTSQASTFDSGSGKFAAVFGETGANRMEVRGFLQEQNFADGVVAGQSGKIRALVLQKTSEQDATLRENSEKTQYPYILTIKGSGQNVNEASAALDLSRISGETKAPDNSDMPSLPAFTASVRFPGTSKITHNAESVLYDPLDGTLELTFKAPSSNNNAGPKDPLRFIFKDIFFPQGNKTSLDFYWQSIINGTAELGSSTLTSITAEPTNNNDSIAAPEIPPSLYIGSYQASADSVKFSAIGYLDYLGKESQNTAEYAFSAFPSLKMKLVICYDGGFFAQKIMTLNSYDYLTSYGRFTDGGKTTEQFLETVMIDKWNTLYGNFLDAETAKNKKISNLDTHQLMLQKFEGADSINCSYFSSSKASTTTNQVNLFYSGYLKKNDKTSVPASVTIYPVRNPSTSSEDPTLDTALRVGFFEGVTISSSFSYLDWSKGQVVAAFNRSAGAALEFRATLKEGPLTDAFLSGPHSGIIPLTLNRNGRSYFDSNSESSFKLLMGEPNPTVALLSIKRKREDIAAPVNSDLPYIPGLEVSLKVDGLSETSQNAKRVIYDPIEGTLDIELSDTSSLELSGLFLIEGDTPGTFIPFKELKDGRAIHAGRSIADLKASRLTKPNEELPLHELPSKVYVGTFTGANKEDEQSPDILEWPAIITIDYQGTTGTNSADYIFPTFPNLRMTITLCNGDLSFAEKQLFLSSVDHVRRTAIFKSANSSATALSKNDLDIVNYPTDWNNFKGVFKSTSETSSSGSEKATIQVRANSNIKSCSQLPK